METDALITLLLENQAGVATTDARVRAQTLRNLQCVLTYYWNFRNWHFRQKSDQVTVLANTHQIGLPDDWQSWGPGGGLFLANTRNTPLDWCSSWTFNRLLRNENRIDVPRVYTELGVDDDGVRLLGVYPTPAANTLFDLDYYRIAPTLTDDDDGLLNLFPSAWHESVLYEAVVALDMKDVANIQSREQKALLKEIVAVMVNEERGGKQTNHRLVPFQAGTRHRRLR